MVITLSNGYVIHLWEEVICVYRNGERFAYASKSPAGWWFRYYWGPNREDFTEIQGACNTYRAIVEWIAAGGSADWQQDLETEPAVIEVEMKI